MHASNNPDMLPLSGPRVLFQPAQTADTMEDNKALLNIVISQFTMQKQP